MIWHIFKKDWRLFRFHALLLALFEFTNVIVLIVEPLSNIGIAGLLRMIFPVSALVGGVALMVAIFHQEAIPGVRQDWLIRPINRRDLLLAKLLSILILVQLPLFASDVLYGLSYGFSVTQSVAAAFSRNIVVLVTISLPAVAIASVSRNFSEAVAIILGLALVSGVFMVGTRPLYWELRTIYDVTAETGLAWIPLALGYAVVLIGVISVLAVQYMKRKTLFARIMVGLAGIAFWALVLFTPWTTAFAIESRLSSRPNADNTVAVTFDPTIGRVKRTPTPQTRGIDYTIYIPVRVEGLAPGSIVRVDLSDAYSTNELGTTRHFSRDKNLDLHGNGPNHLRLKLEALSRDPTLTPYNDPLIKDKPFQLQIELSMTLLELRNETPLPGLLGPVAQPIPKHICGNWISSFSAPWPDEGDPRETAVNVRCMPVIAQPPCVTLVLTDLPQPYVMRPSLQCYRDYSPHYGHLAPGGEAVDASAYIGDPSGTVRYPQGLEGLTKTNATLRWYEPVDHFKRKIVIPNMRLGDWVSEK